MNDTDILRGISRYLSNWKMSYRWHPAARKITPTCKATSKKKKTHTEKGKKKDAGESISTTKTSIKSCLLTKAQKASHEDAWQMPL